MFVKAGVLVKADVLVKLGVIVGKMEALVAVARLCDVGVVTGEVFVGCVVVVLSFVS